MIIDFNDQSAPRLSSSKYDVCVIGAGPAGIMLATALGARGKRVVLLESGGRTLGIDAQSLNVGLTEGSFIRGIDDKYLGSSRLRLLGGTSNHWEGWSRAFDSADFEQRPWISNSGWPISIDTLAPYYSRASYVLGLSDFVSLESSLDKHEQFASTTHNFETHFFQMRPCRFGQMFGEELSASTHIDCVLGATVVDIIHNPAQPEVITGVEVRSPSTKANTSISADIFVLAAGGIENARVLLNATRVFANGIGNERDLVGRYFADHPHVVMGTWFLFNKHSFSRTRFKKHKVADPSQMNPQVKTVPLEALGVVTPRARTLVENRLLSFSIEFRVRDFSALAEVEREQAKSLRILHGLLGDTHAAKGEPIAYKLYVRSDQTPIPESRVTLMDDVDRFGQRKAKLNWIVSAEDRENLRRGVILFGQEIASLGLGRVKVFSEDDAWPTESRGGYHHMGTTRMHSDPTKGVVDSNCLIHGMRNFYVAGSSVFTTYSAWNPTLTIMALSLRLADHIGSL